MPISVRPQTRGNRHRPPTAFMGHRHRLVSVRSHKPRTEPRHRCPRRCQRKIEAQHRHHPQPSKRAATDNSCSPKRRGSAKGALQRPDKNLPHRQNPAKSQPMMKKCRKREYQWMNSPPKSEPRWSASPCRSANPPMRKKLHPVPAKAPAHRPGPQVRRRARSPFFRGLHASASQLMAKVPAGSERTAPRIRWTNLSQIYRQKSANRSGVRPVPSRPWNPGQRRHQPGADLVATGDQHKKNQPNQRITSQ